LGERLFAGAGGFFLKKRPQKQPKKPEAKGLELKWSPDPRRVFSFCSAAINRGATKGKNEAQGHALIVINV
jgi:hypothetical protein